MDHKRLLLIFMIFAVMLLSSGGIRTIRASDEDPVTDTVSETQVPETPVPEYPKETETGKQVGFYWTPSENAESYEVSWKNDSGSEAVLELDNSDTTCQSGSCIVFEELPAEGGYTWTVTAKNEAGSSASEEAEFFVRSELPVPEAYRPNGVINSQKRIAFEWEDIRNNITEYRIQVMDRSTDRIIRDQWYQVSGMWVGNGECYKETNAYLPSGSYAWRVKAKNESSESGWSAWVDFQTNCVDCAQGAYLNTTTSAVYPQGMTTDHYPTFKWLAVTGAAYYKILLSDSNGNTVLDVQVPSSNCSLEFCSLDSGLSMPVGSSYTWSVSTYGGNNGRWGTDEGTVVTIGTSEAKDIAFIWPEDGGKLDSENPLVIWTDPGRSAAAFRLLIINAADEPMFYADLTREDVWCDGKTCSVVFRAIPEGDDYRIYITPYSETNTPGGTISLNFSR